MGERDAGPRHGRAQAWQVSHSLSVSGGGGSSCVYAFLFLASSSVEAQIALCSVMTVWHAFSYAHSSRRRARLRWVFFHVSVCRLFMMRAIVSWMCAISLASDLVLIRWVLVWAGKESCVLSGDAHGGRSAATTCLNALQLSSLVLLS